MNVVLSRKGIDSSCGNMYSPLERKTGEYTFIPRPETSKTVTERYKGISYKKLPTNFLDF